MKLSTATVSVAPTMTRLTAIAARRDAGDLAACLTALTTWLDDDLRVVAQALAQASRGGETQAHEAGRYLLGLGGKRLRPLVTLLASRLFAADTPAAALDYAAAAELVHAATLLHDDVIDGAGLRRGRPSANQVYGNAVSILGGDHLLVAALRLVHTHGDDVVLASLLATLDRMVAAEALQLDQRGTFGADRDAYWRIVEGKTAGLFAWAFSAGGRAAGCDDEQAQHLAAVGRDVGIAFQLLDDMLDLTGDAATTGKAALADVREGKRTWPLILAAERDASVAERLALYATADGDPSPQQAAALVAAVAATGALAETAALAAAAAASARERLQTLPAGVVRDQIDALITALVERKS